MTGARFSLLGRILLSVLAVVLLAFLAMEGVRQAKKPRPPAIALPATGSNTPKSKGQPTVKRSQVNWFRDISPEVKLDFVPSVGPLGSFFMPEINGSGGAFFDYDNDGDLDIFLVNFGKSPRAPADFPIGTKLSHCLYRQDEGGALTNVTESLKLISLSISDTVKLGIGCAVGDVNNDGFQDLYLTNYGPDQLVINRGATSFEDRTADAQLGCAEWGTAAAFFDYDRDGWLDLVVVNYCADPIHHHTIACGTSQGTVSYCGPHKFEPTIDRLYHNEGPQSMQDGVPKFRDVTESSGLASATSFGLGLAVCDFNGDHWPDIFVASDMRENRLWINQHDGTFREEAGPRGCALSGEGMMQGCMGVAVGDIDHDQDFDLVVTNLVTEGSTLYINDGQGVFRDESLGRQLLQNTRQHTGWGVALIDLDHDGHLDLPTVNGYVVPNRSMFAPHGEDKFQETIVTVEHPLQFLGSYNGKNCLLTTSDKPIFREQTVDAGDFGRDESCARGLIYGDIDRDGDLDLLTTSVGTPARLYRNDLSGKGHWLSVRCLLTNEHRDALGAVVKVVTKDKTWTSQCAPSTSYLASNEPFAHFGLGKFQQFDRIEVIWPDGKQEVFAGGATSQRLTLQYGSGAAPTGLSSQ